MPTEPLDDPPVNSELDLREFRWIKLDIVALLNSEFNAIADDTAWRCGVTLWTKAWHQVPAGSLPDDDVLLCHFSGLGRDLKTWRAKRHLALHGFVKCSDGRLYHKFICKLAIEADAEHRKYLRRKSADRVRKSAGKEENSSGIPAETPLLSSGKPPVPARVSGAEIQERITLNGRAHAREALASPPFAWKPNAAHQQYALLTLKKGDDWLNDQAKLYVAHSVRMARPVGTTDQADAGFKIWLRRSLEFEKPTRSRPKSNFRDRDTDRGYSETAGWDNVSTPEQIAQYEKDRDAHKRRTPEELAELDRLMTEFRAQGRVQPPTRKAQ